MCQTLDEHSTVKDWGIHIPIVGYTEATTGLAVGSRHGLGKVKQVDIVFLWAQQVVIDGKAEPYKKDTKDMLADLFASQYMPTEPECYWRGCGITTPLDAII